MIRTSPSTVWLAPKKAAIFCLISFFHSFGIISHSESLCHSASLACHMPFHKPIPSFTLTAFWRQSSSCFHFCGLDYEEKGILDQFSRSISFFAQTQRFFSPLLVGLHGSTDTTSRKSAIKEKIFWKVTISSALISFLQKIIARLTSLFFSPLFAFETAWEVFLFQTAGRVIVT